MHIKIPKHEENISLGRPMCRREYNIKMDLKETGYENVDCIHLPKDRVQW